MRPNNAIPPQPPEHWARILLQADWPAPATRRPERAAQLTYDRAWELDDGELLAYPGVLTDGEAIDYWHQVYSLVVLGGA